MSGNDLGDRLNLDGDVGDQSRKRKAGTAGLLPVGHHQGSGPSDAKFVRLSNPGVMGGGGGSQYGDTGSVGGGDAAQRKNHSQIEKKRRDRMNTYIKELSTILPSCPSKKMDKLTVLRLALQHMRSIKGEGNADDEFGGLGVSERSSEQGCHKPKQLNDGELKRLIFNHTRVADDCFLFVVDTARGKILYVSESVNQVLLYSQSDLFGQSLFDILHPKDIAKVKEQMSSPDGGSSARLHVDSKHGILQGRGGGGGSGGSGQGHNGLTDSSGRGGGIHASRTNGQVQNGSLPRFCPGARRSFFCRMKTKMRYDPTSLADLTDPSTIAASSGGGRSRKFNYANSERKFRVVHCTGYLRSWSEGVTPGGGSSFGSNSFGGGGGGGGLMGGGAYGPESVGMPEGADQTSAETESADSALSCLVAVGRLLSSDRLPPPSSTPAQSEMACSSASSTASVNSNNHQAAAPNPEFTARHTIDGNFSYADSHVAMIMGYLPHEMNGSTIYQHIYCDDIPEVKVLHEQALRTPQEMSLERVRMKLKDGRFEAFNIKWKQFRNPWTGEIEYIVARYSPCKSQQLQQEHPINVQQQQQRQVTHQSITNTQQAVADANLINYLIADFAQTNPSQQQQQQQPLNHQDQFRPLQPANSQQQQHCEQQPVRNNSGGEQFRIPQQFVGAGSSAGNLMPTAGQAGPSGRTQNNSRSPSISPSFGLAMANAATAATAGNTSNGGGGGGVGNDPTKIGLQIVSEFRSESMNSNSSSETSPLPDYIFHQVTPAATTQQSNLQASTVGHQQVIVSNPNLILGGHNNVQIQAQSPFMTEAAATTPGASLQRQVPSTSRPASVGVINPSILDSILFSPSTSSAPTPNPQQQQQMFSSSSMTASADTLNQLNPSASLQSTMMQQGSTLLQQQQQQGVRKSIDTPGRKHQKGVDTYFAMASGNNPGQGQQPSSGGALLGTGASEVQMPGSPESSNGGNGNDMDNEATRTMIMNLLEADAGLADGVDQGSLPFQLWPPNGPPNGP